MHRSHGVRIPTRNDSGMSAAESGHKTQDTPHLPCMPPHVARRASSIDSHPPSSHTGIASSRAAPCEQDHPRRHAPPHQGLCPTRGRSCTGRRPRVCQGNDDRYSGTGTLMKHTIPIHSWVTRSRSFCSRPPPTPSCARCSWPCPRPPAPSRTRSAPPRAAPPTASTRLAMSSWRSTCSLTSSFLKPSSTRCVVAYKCMCTRVHICTCTQGAVKYACSEEVPEPVDLEGALHV